MQRFLQHREGLMRAFHFAARHYARANGLTFNEKALEQLHDICVDGSTHYLALVLDVWPAEGEEPEGESTGEILAEPLDVQAA